MATEVWPLEGVAVGAPDMVTNSLADRIIGLGSSSAAFTGDVWYVSTDGDDGNTGRTPSDAFLTIGAAIAAANAGDAITISGGTYTETGLNLNKSALELWCEMGIIIAPAAGTALVVSGGYNKIMGHLRIAPAAGQVGIHVTGTHCWFEHVRVSGGATGWDIDATGQELYYCRSGQPTVAGFDVGANGCKLYHCGTAGADGTTYGFHITGGADRGVLFRCTSAQHGTSGFAVDTGSENWTLLACSSGAGDGRWIDTDNANVWSNFTYDDEVYHLTTFAGGGGGQDNLFKVSGCVEIHYIYGHVETVLSADVDNIYLDLWDGTVSVEITDNGGGGTDTNSADVGSVFIKSEIATTAITLLQSNQGRVEENTSFRLPRTPFILNQKKDTNTHIRVVYSGVATSGAIHWHCKWEPLTESGWIEAA